jgi:hypothetical protein
LLDDKIRYGRSTCASMFAFSFSSLGWDEIGLAFLMRTALAKYYLTWQWVEMKAGKERR